jgi:outer membrane lipoprotein-sorting protein
MRKSVSTIVAFSLFMACTNVAVSGEDDGRAIVNNAIKSMGGEAKLAKFQTMTWKETGTYYGMGEGLPYTGEYAINPPDQFRMVIKDVFIIVVNGDKGWISAGGEVKDMSKDQLASEINNQKAGWIASLLPLKDKAYTVARVVGKDEKTKVVSVTRKGYPEVKLHFDAKTGLRVKSEYTTKASDLEFKEVKMEMTFSDFRDVDGAKIPHKIEMKRDGKRFVEAEMSEIKSAAKLDAKLFAKPTND